MANKTYQFVNHLWDDKHAATLDPRQRLIYRSNLLGSDQRITNTGGGNTSSKLPEKDPLTGETVEVPAKSVPFFKSGKELRERLNASDEA